MQAQGKKSSYLSNETAWEEHARSKNHFQGFGVYVKDPQMFVPYPDDNYLFFRPSTEKTVEGIRRFSPHDAEANTKFLAFFERASELLNRSGGVPGRE